MATLSEHKAKYGSRTLGVGVTGGLGARTPIATKKVEEKPGVVGTFVNKAKSLGGQTVDIGAAVAKATGRFVVNRGVDIAKSGYLAARTPIDIQTDRFKVNAAEIRQEQLSSIQRKITQNYKSGNMSRENYTKALRELSLGFQEISKDAKKVYTAPSGAERATAIVDTATNILSLGGLSLAKAGVSSTIKAKTASKTAQMLVNVNQQLEKAILKVPAITPLIERNAANLVIRQSQKLAGETAEQFLAREGKNVAIGLLIKQPIFYQMNIGGAQSVYNNILEGDYGDAVKESAWLGTQLLKGGPLGAAAQSFKWLTKKGGKLAYGTGSYIDELSKQIGNGKNNQIANYLESLPKGSKEFKKAERVLRIAQETNLQMAGENAKEAAERTLVHWVDHAIGLEEVTPKKVVELLDNWATANEKLNLLGRKGQLGEYIQKNLDKHVVVRWDVDAKKGLARKLEEAGDNPQAIVQAYTQWKNSVGNSAANNNLLIRKIESIMEDVLNYGGSGKVSDIAEQIRAIPAVSVMPKGIPANIKKQFEKLGFAIAQPYKAGSKKVTPNIAYDDTRKLVTAAVKGDTDIFTQGAAPLPPVQAIASAIESVGLSPQASTKLAQAKLSQEVAANLQKTEVARAIGLLDGDVDSGGKVILSKLQHYVDQKQPSKVLNYGLVAGRAPGPAITDIRQLAIPEIVEALGITSSQARQVSRAIMKGYLDTPLEFRGMGDKIVDGLYALNPLHKYYSRIQSALRYTYNPFFRFQEQVETSILSRAQARTILWKKSKEELDDITRVLDESGLFKTGLSGEAAQDLTLGRVTATITQSQKRNIAGLASKMAEARGVTIEDLVRNYGDDVGDALRVVVQYPNKGILNSSLARTLNLAFFPMRYNTKVTALAAQILSKEPPSVQLAMVNSILDLKNWLKSDEGIRWQRDHADAIQLFNWATPIGSINYWAKILSGNAKLADFGSIGGLPLGVISQVLDSQGIISINNPYVNPKTGDVIPKYIPETTKARAYSALTDLLGSTFTYPGRILGLPGKQQMLNNLAKSMTGAKYDEFEKLEQTEKLTDLQKNYIRVLKGDTSDEAVDALYYSPRPGGYQGYTIPPLALPIRPLGEQRESIERRTGLPKKASTKKKGRTRKTKPLPQSITRPT